MNFDGLDPIMNAQEECVYDMFKLTAEKHNSIADHELICAGYNSNELDLINSYSINKLIFDKDFCDKNSLYVVRADALKQLVVERDQKIKELEISKSRIQELNYKLIERDLELSRIMTEMHQSIVFQLLEKYKHFVDIILPIGTQRRKTYDLLLIGGKILFFEGVNSFFNRFWNRSIKIHCKQLNFNMGRLGKSVVSSRTEQSDELLAYSQEVPATIILVKAPIRLKKGYNLIRFHVPDGMDRPCDISDLNSGDCRHLSLAVLNISIWDGTTKFKINWGCNWYGMEESNLGVLRWLSNDATIILDSSANCNTKLELKMHSFYRPRKLEIFVCPKSINLEFKKNKNEKFVLLSSIESYTDSNVLRDTLEDILQNLGRQVC
jgi:hypothetical protein